MKPLRIVVLTLSITLGVSAQTAPTVQQLQQTIQQLEQTIQTLEQAVPIPAAVKVAVPAPATSALSAIEQAVKTISPSLGSPAAPATKAAPAAIPAATTNPLDRPANWAGGGAIYDPSARKATGWFSFAHLLDAKSGTYLFTTEDVTPVKATTSTPFTVQTSVRIGVATILKEFGRLKILGLMDGGGATIGSSSSGAASGGTIATLRIKTSFQIMGGFRVLKTTLVPGTPKLYEMGFGYSWGQ